MRIKEDYDGAEPSGNSIATDVLLRLAHMTGSEMYRTSAEKTLNAFASKMGAQPSAMPQMLVALIRHITPPQQIVLAGDEIVPFLDALRTRFLPHHTLLKSGDVPAAADMPPVMDGRSRTCAKISPAECQLRTQRSYSRDGVERVGGLAVRPPIGEGELLSADRDGGTGTEISLPTAT
jgi:uncharacterized protein YyaL (SSP411 family)